MGARESRSALSIASTGISDGRVAMQPQRGLQSGERELVDPQRAGERVLARGLDGVRAADEQPRLRTAEQLVAARSTTSAAPAAIERRTGGSS